MSACALCGRAMIEVAPGVLMHEYELREILAPLTRTR